MKTELFTDGGEYTFRLNELVENNYEIISHGYNEGIYWIRYYVKEYKKGITSEWF